MPALRRKLFEREPGLHISRGVPAGLQHGGDNGACGIGSGISAGPSQFGKFVPGGPELGAGLLQLVLGASGGSPVLLAAGLVAVVEGEEPVAVGVVEVGGCLAEEFGELGAVGCGQGWSGALHDAFLTVGASADSGCGHAAEFMNRSSVSPER